MREKKGFISTSIIYSFFLVFILLMIAFLMSFVNKRYLNEKVKDGIDIPSDKLTYVPDCLSGEDSLKDCLFKMQNKEEDFGVEGISVIQSAIKSKGVPNFGDVVTAEEGMFATADNDYTKVNQDNIYSYYYRGAEDDNYVVFSGFVWQIVRINGDETIRLIYKGNYDSLGSEAKVTGSDYITTIPAGAVTLNFDNISFNISNTDASDLNDAEELIKKYCIDDYQKVLCNSNKAIFEAAIKRNGSTALYNVGYMNSDGWSQSDYNIKYDNKYDSTIKKLIDLWYVNNIEENNDYLSENTMFCGDKNRICKYEADSICEVNTDGTLITTIDQYYFSAINRINANDPDLICYNSGESFGNTSAYVNGFIDKNLSRYSVNKNGKNFSNDFCYGSECIDAVHKTIGTSVAGYTGMNGDLSYPIALISADELIFSGALYGTGSNSFLKGNTEDEMYWTMTVSYLDSLTGGTTDSEQKQGTFYYAMNGYGEVISLNDKYNLATIRPVINLKSDILYCSGDGTASNPYIIGNGSC